MVGLTKDEEVNMRRLRRLSHGFVALLTLLFCSLFGLFFPVQEDFWIGFGSDKFNWGVVFGLIAFANLPDMANMCIYLALRYKLHFRATVESKSNSSSMDEEYYHGIYMGPPPSASIDLAIVLPGQVENGSSATLEQNLPNATNDRASLSLPLPNPNPPSGIESLAMRALLTHVLASFTDFIFVPTCIIFTEPGAMRETTVLSAIVVNTYWLPVLVALSTLGKFRMIIKEVLLEVFLFCY